MPDARARAPRELNAAPLRLCPDCGGILDATRPSWTTTVDLASGIREPDAEPPRWQCLICGYRLSRVTSQL
jgi:hypothetical protein